MGREIERLAIEQGHSIRAIIQREDDENAFLEKLTNVDIAIEFSSPESAVANFLHCFKAGVPVVSGTTGWNAHLKEVIDQCDTLGASFFYASNFSVGVNIFFELNRHLAQLMQGQADYSVSMEEIHHLQKKDAPSGTAITLATGILEHITQLQGWDNNVRLNHEETFSTLSNLLPIVSTRSEGVTGTHEITYRSTLDEITIRHQAHSRLAFAQGALLAATWMQGKKGVYTMQDLLKLK